VDTLDFAWIFVLETLFSAAEAATKELVGTAFEKLSSVPCKLIGLNAREKDFASAGDEWQATLGYSTR
jgi:hypothetical protein